MSVRPIVHPLVRLRRRLTAWYAATFGLILLLLGGGLYVAIHAQIKRQLRDSLADATTELVGAARIRERESKGATGDVVDAVDELRTPIAVLRTRADVALQAARSPDEYTAALRGMAHEATRLGRVVDDLLMLARADAGERPVARERFFLDDVVIDAAVSVRTLAQAAGVELMMEEFEETPVVGDAALVRELVVVLLDNAVKFTPGGGTVRVRVQPLPVPTLNVEDTGCGIPAGQLPHVFERFYRGDPSRPRDGGAGLGLSIAQWIAAQHGARLILTSEAGQGARATVVFPRAGPGGSAYG